MIRSTRLYYCRKVLPWNRCLKWSPTLVMLNITYTTEAPNSMSCGTDRIFMLIGTSTHPGGCVCVCAGGSILSAHGLLPTKWEEPRGEGSPDQAAGAHSRLLFLACSWHLSGQASSCCSQSKYKVSVYQVYLVHTDKAMVRSSPEGSAWHCQIAHTGPWRWHGTRMSW